MNRNVQNKRARRRARKAKAAERFGRWQEEQRGRPTARVSGPFVFPNDDADPRFQSLVESTLATIDFEDRRHFTEYESQVFRWHRLYGWKRAIAHTERRWNDAINGGGSSPRSFDLLHFETKVGRLLFMLMPQEMLAQYIPYNNVEIAPYGRGFVVVYRSLCTHSSNGRAYYYSRLRPTLMIDGVPKIIAFSGHAIERACSRVIHDVHDYMALGDVFALFDQCTYFERAAIRPAGLGFTFYETCADPRWFVWQYVEKVIQTPEPDRHYYYRVGYCPAVIDGEFLLAKTLLFPGYKGTPEHEALRASNLHEPKKRETMRKAYDLTRKYLETTGDFSLIRWFHDHGTPQVLAFDHALYDASLYGSA